MAMPHPQVKYLKCMLFIIYFVNIILSLSLNFFTRYMIWSEISDWVTYLSDQGWQLPPLIPPPPTPPPKLRHWGWQNTDNKNNYAFHSPDLSTTFIHVIYKLTAWWHVCQKISHYMYMYITNIPVHNLFSNNTSYEVKDSV